MNNYGNLNPNNTGYQLPNQYTNKDMSFVPPPPGPVGPGFQESTYDTGLEVAPQNQAQVVSLERALGKDYAGCYWWRIRLNHSGRGYSQVGPYARDNGKRADGALWSDGRGYLCLPPLTTTTALGNPNVDRASSATAYATHVFSHYEPGGAQLYRETSATNPVPILVAGFAAPAGVSGINALRAILVNGVEYLAICYQNGGAGNSVQIVTSLSPFAGLAAMPTGPLPTYDMIQTAIDGNALLVYMADATGQNGVIRAIRTDVGVGVVALSAIRCTMPPGGYGVGLSEAEDDSPMAYWVAPQDGNFMLFNLTGAGVTNRGKLIKTDARGYLPVTVDVPLAWTTFATKWRGGIVVCDTQTHWYLNKRNPRGKWRLMDITDNLAADSNKRYVCCGHHEKDGRFLIEINESQAPGGAGTTQRYSMEFDYDTWAATRVETKVALAASGVQSIGGAHMAWSPFTDYKYPRVTIGSNFVWQRIGPLGENLYNMRKTTGAAVGTGVEYATSESLTLPVMDIEGLEDCAKTLTAVSGPKAAAVATGGTGAYVLVEELLSGRTGSGPNGQGAQFFGTEPSERVQRREYDTVSWTYQIQPKVTIVQQVGGTDPSHLTPNAYNNEIFLEGVAVRDPVNAPVASILRALDRQRTMPTP